MREPGNEAPDFSALTTRGDTFSLSAHRGRVVVLFFFPKAFTPGCTRETSDFAGAWQDFQDLGAEVVGISTDDHQTQCEFAREMKSPFAMISDVGAKISALYGAKWPLFDRSRRVTFVIDPEGNVRNVFKHELRFSQHMPDAREAAKKIREAMLKR